MRQRHPKKEIERVLSSVDGVGWRIELSRKGHLWGHLLCDNRSRDGCRIRLDSTPRNAGDHAKDIKRAVASCPHGWAIELR